MATFQTSDGANLYYEERGEGKPIVMVHGWSADHKSFLPAIEGLNSNRIVLYDFRGHGASDRVDYGLTLERFADDLHELIEHLGLKKPVIAGWSMGTSTVLEYIRKYGDENISSFVILDMTPKMVNDDEWKMGLFHGKYTLEEAQKNLTTLNDNMSAFLEEFVRICLPYFSDEEVAATMKLASKNTPFVMSALWYAMVVADYRDVLDKISVPTKICYGEKSTLYSKETAEYFASKIPNSTIVPFENCTHFLVVENPQKLTEVLKEVGA